MNYKSFDDILETCFDKMRSVLKSKSDEYSSGKDKLHNFKIAGALKQETPRQALMGMLVKHTVSIYDMGLSEEEYSLELWDEKIIDHLNYLVLLRAAVVEEMNEREGRERPRLDLE